YDMEDFQEERVHIDIREDFKFRGSKYYLIHALYQLIKNVHKHAGVECEIEIWTEDYKLHFRDNGRGISKEKLSHIFEHFYSIDKSGTGVGLAFCKLVMDTFGGSISCETEKGKYTEFILSFPKEKVKELPEEDADKEEE
ncbi:MAG: ATP-binding protein, partial [Cytophagales bacterium]|nr:ATP-binding protein [Cytophagales bacterium]